MKLYLVILMVIFVCSLVSMREITLRESISMALDNNIDLQAERMTYESSKWSQANALTNFLPKVNLNTSAIRIDNETYQEAQEIHRIPVISSTGMPTGDYVPFSAGAIQGVHKTSYRTNFVLQQPLFAGGKILSGYRISKLTKDMSASSYIQKKNEIIFQVTDIYFNILKLYELRQLTNKSILSAQAQKKRITQMQQLGMARNTDIIQWRVRIQEHKSSLLEIEDSILTLNELWNMMIGTEDFKPAQIELHNIADEIADLSSKDDNQIDEYIKTIVEKSLEYNPIMGIADLNKMINRENYRISKGNYLPNLNLQFRYEIDDGDRLDFTGEKSWNIIAILSVPLFTSGDNYSQMKVAQKQYRKSELQRKSVQEYMAIEAKQISRKIFRIAKQVQSNELNLEYNEGNYQIMKELHNQELLTNTELLDAERMLFNSQIQYLSSVYDFVITKYEQKKIIGIKEDNR